MYSHFKSRGSQLHCGMSLCSASVDSIIASVLSESSKLRSLAYPKSAVGRSASALKSPIHHLPSAPQDVVGLGPPIKTLYFSAMRIFALASWYLVCLSLVSRCESCIVEVRCLPALCVLLDSEGGDIACVTSLVTVGPCPSFFHVKSHAWDRLCDQRVGLYINMHMRLRVSHQEGPPGLTRHLLSG